MGLINSRKLKKDRKKFVKNQKSYRMKKLRLISDPLKGSHQAKGIVVSKFQIEAKQPNSALRKCCRVQLKKTGQVIGAFIPGNLAQKFIDEHDEVILEKIGGKQGKTKGDLSGIRFQVIKVNDQPLKLLWKGKIEKGRR